MPRRRYDEVGRLLPIAQQQLQTGVAQQQVAELPVRNLADLLGARLAPKGPPLQPKHQQRQSSASSSRGASSSTDTAYDLARQRQNDLDNQWQRQQQEERDRLAQLQKQQDLDIL